MLTLQREWVLHHFNVRISVATNFPDISRKNVCNEVRFKKNSTFITPHFRLTMKSIEFCRLEFDQDDIPDLTSEIYLQDIHSISSLLKMYFRELPNPLLTYQLYNKFSVSFVFKM